MTDWITTDDVKAALGLDPSDSADVEWLKVVTRGANRFVADTRADACAPSDREKWGAVQLATRWYGQRERHLVRPVHLLPADKCPFQLAEGGIPVAVARIAQPPHFGKRLSGVDARPVRYGDISDGRRVKAAVFPLIGWRLGVFRFGKR